MGLDAHPSSGGARFTCSRRILLNAPPQKLKRRHRRWRRVEGDSQSAQDRSDGSGQPSSTSTSHSYRQARHRIRNRTRAGWPSMGTARIGRPCGAPHAGHCSGLGTGPEEWSVTTTTLSACHHSGNGTHRLSTLADFCRRARVIFVAAETRNQLTRLLLETPSE